MNKKNKIKIVVNGKLLTVNLKFSLENLTEKLKTPVNKVAIELNEEIVDKKKLKKIYLKNKDKIEIVHFIGGG
ncbi:sulfur carrier protein ThiS [Pelagibacterales bacterium SAG-MED23]|nr:sulfur carrier protein ThiS [Pelagibacterales bacterium SAG-MED23]